MKAALSAFRDAIAQLRHHLECIAIESELVATEGQGEASSPRDAVASRLQAHIGLGLWKRIFDYNSTIISLYGALERYVDDLVRGFVSRASSAIAQYDDLPEPVRASHIKGTVALMSLVDQRRYRGALSTEGLVANLHSCLAKVHPYHLNLDAFVLHSANYRAEVIAEALQKIGVSGVRTRLQTFEPLAGYFAEKYGGEIPTSASFEDLYYYIDDLTERRNDVSHGTASELLSGIILHEYVNFVERYAVALFQLVYSDSMEFEIPYRARDLGPALKIFNDVIVCFEVANIRISVGDELVARTQDRDHPFRVGPIVEIQIDHESFDAIEPQDPTKVALRVEYKAKPNQTFALLAK